ncbi:MAG: YbaK/EbsC family protein [Nitriliruptorales bacterium]|nr:YbaK/EbsC family protein [Nitriliruptorales bacterium]
MNLHRNNVLVAEVAAEHGVAIDVRRFQQGTRTAADAARAIGCDVGAIVKSIVLMSDAGPLLVLTSGANRADYGKVSAAAAVADVRRADASQARDATGFAIGGTPPWGHPRRLPTLCDTDLMSYDKVWAAAGTPDSVFAVSPHDLLRISQARLADVAADA